MQLCIHSHWICAFTVLTFKISLKTLNERIALIMQFNIYFNKDMDRYITIRYYCCYKQDLLVTQKNDLNITIYE
ncbi:hypothetical protein DERF_004649 [Dermatophagoides farinae]|uniref:Uncharacterized protein n=1 Tax=Dermatophagoides farinae TaxID=6954 RepID=A0A922L5S3_DERFA|nr:hypothetical protein DERF_004649 [Dermatophagoides farinae]